jgi:stress responsive alpha/beta barrel protein
LDVTADQKGVEDVLRHTAFFMFREGIEPEAELRMLKGLAYMRFACPSVLALDFGTDLTGGTAALAEVKPWKRIPRWHGAQAGPPSNYDVSLHLDFADQAGLDAYNKDDVHHEVAEYNASICQGEFTARVDWWYDGEPLIARDLVRHSAMFLWADDADDDAKKAAHAEVEQLAGEAGVRSVSVGTNVGTLTTDYDWLMDVQLDDAAAAEALVGGQAYRDAMASIAAVTKYEWTARHTHRMVGL